MPDDHDSAAQRFHEFVEFWPQPVWTATAAGEWDQVSRQWLEYTGLPAQQHLGSNWLERIHPEDQAATKAAWLTSLTTGQNFHIEHRIHGHDGVSRWFESRAIPLHDSQHQIVQWIGSSTDIHQARELRLGRDAERPLLANLVELAPAVFCSYAQRTDGSVYFKFAGPDITSLLGFHPADLEKADFNTLAFIHREDRERVSLSLETSVRTMSARHNEFRIIHPQRGERWIENQSKPCVDEKGKLVWHGFLTDITERKREEEGQHFLLDLDSALQSVSTPEDIGAVGTQLIAHHFNAGRCVLSGVDKLRGEITLLNEHTRSNTLPPSEATSTFDKWASDEAIQLLAAGNSVAIADTSLHPLSAARYAASYQPSHIAALIATPLLLASDWVCLLTLIVSEPRDWYPREINLVRSAAERVWRVYSAAQALEAERALHNKLAANKARLRLALKASGIGIWEMNLISGEMQWDERCKAIYGFPADYTLGCSIRQSPSFHPDDLDLITRTVDASHDPAGEGHFELRHRILAWHDGSVRIVYVRGQTVFEGEGASRCAVRSIGTLQDITSLIRNQTALERANRELEQFAYAAAHDLPEPLRNIALATESLSGPFQSAFASEAAFLKQSAVDSAQRVQQMIQDLRLISSSFASLDAPVKPIDSNIALALALKNLHPVIAEKGAHITFAPLPPVLMHESHLVDLFQNLLQNSLKFSRSQPVISISSVWLGGICTFFVKDNGMGIAPEYHARAFKMFKQLHGREFGGTGVGLTLCKRIIEHYGGNIWIESRSGEGASILFTPPLAANPSHRRPPQTP